MNTPENAGSLLDSEGFMTQDQRWAENGVEINRCVYSSLSRGDVNYAKKKHTHLKNDEAKGGGTKRKHV